MKTVINLNGLTHSISGIKNNLLKKDDWYFDILESNNYLVSFHNTPVAVFEDFTEAIKWYISQTRPTMVYTEEELEDGFDYLEQFMLEDGFDYLEQFIKTK